MSRLSWVISASRVLIERAARSMFASTSSSLPLALVGNTNVEAARAAVIANVNALRFIADPLLSLLVDDITDLAGTLFRSFDARNLNRVSILRLQSIRQLSFQICRVDLSNLAASYDQRRGAVTVKSAIGSKQDKGQDQHAHDIVLPGPSIVRPEQNLLQGA